MVWDEVEVDEAEEKTAAMTAAQITGTDIGSLQCILYIMIILYML